MDHDHLGSFIKKVTTCQDIAASEVGRFAVHLVNHRTATSYWDFLALAGTAVSRPDFFAGQPLTQCPPGLAVELKEEAFQIGEHLLRSRASTIRRSLLNSGFSSSGLSPGEDPEGFCRAVVRVVDIPHGVSDDYRLAVGLILLIVLSEFIGELTSAFWQTPDSELADLLLQSVQKQRERATKELADRITKGLW